VLLEIEGLRKSYRGGVRANDDLSLSVDAGEVYGLLGHNGAGKTTLVNQVVGLLVPDAGSVWIDGRDAIAHPAWARTVCSVQPQAQVPIAGLTPRQIIGLVGRIRGLSSRDAAARTRELADAMEIGEWLDTDGARLSGGVKRLVSFGMAAVAPGRLVILDEPTNDVDPVRRRHLWRMVRQLADGGSAVLLVTHNVVEAERAVDRLSILDHGCTIAEGTPAELKARMGAGMRVEVVLEPGVSAPVLVPFAGHVVRDGHRILAALPADGAGDALAWARSLVAAGVAQEFSLSPATLEDVYVQVAGESGAGIQPGARIQPSVSIHPAAGSDDTARPGAAGEEVA
jgi:ABC-2 type transport system ATP-binding protein